jgi:ribosomal protein L22
MNTILTAKSALLNISYKKGIEFCNSIKIMTNNIFTENKFKISNYRLLLFYLKNIEYQKKAIFIKRHGKKLGHISKKNFIIPELYKSNNIKINRILKNYKKGIYPKNISQIFFKLIKGTLDSKFMNFKGNIEILELQCQKYNKENRTLFRARGSADIIKKQYCKIYLKINIINKI